jgi:hypothetical protein
MATWYTYCCNNCTYTVEMSGVPDVLFSGNTIPVVCKKCNGIYDRLTETKGIVVDLENQCCEECGCAEFKLWDYKTKKCTKCDKGKLTIDEDGIITMAD